MFNPFKIFFIIPKAIHRWGRKNYQIAFVPIKDKNIHTIYINHYVIFFTITLIVASIFFTVPYFKKRALKKIEIKQLAAINNQYQEKMNAYKKFIRDHEKQFEKYTKEINDIMEILGQKNSKQLWKPSTLNAEDIDSKKKQFYVFKEHELSASYKTPREITRLNELRIKSIITLEHLKDIKGFLHLKQTAISYIPTQWPIIDSKGYKTSAFGIRLSPFSIEGAIKTFHTGVDIAAAPDTPIVAAADGSIIFSGSKEGYGRTIIIQHRFGYQTLYGHNSTNLVRLFQKVKKGQRIALMGKSGRTTGYHIHFEIRISNVPVDPWPYLIIEH